MEITRILSVLSRDRRKLIVLIIYVLSTVVHRWFLYNFNCSW